MKRFIGANARPLQPTAGSYDPVKIRRRRPAGFAFLCLMACFAVIPGQFRHWFATFGPAHAYVHIAVFCVAFLLTAKRFQSAGGTVVLVILLFIYGASLELLQSRIFKIRLEYGDVFSDATGILLGLLANSITGWRSRQPKLAPGPRRI